MRYLPLTKDDRMEMLDVIGIKKIDDLFEEISHKVDINPELKLPNHMTELEVERHMSILAIKNMHADNNPFFIGGGSYKDHIPAVQSRQYLQYQIQESPVLPAVKIQSRQK